MRILIAAAGSRGDVVPYTGLGAGLVTAGHDVTVAAHSPFEEAIRSVGLRFAALGGDIRELVATTEHRRPSPAMLAKRTKQLTGYLLAAAADAIAAAERGTDVVLYNSTALFGADIADGLGVPGFGAFTLPIEPTGEFPPPLSNSARSLGRWGNRLSGELVLRTLVPFHRASALVRKHFGLSRRTGRHAALHGYSAAVLPRPADWRPGLDVVGYWWPRHDPAWTPPSALVDFLDAGPAPVFLGFGSMLGGQGRWLSGLVRDAVRAAGVRAVAQAGWAGIDGAGDDVLAVGDVPHEWLFPRMAAVVHHGGAGTTGAGLRAGRPTVITPVFADQPLWGARVHALGAGPAPLPVHRLTVGALASAIRAATGDPRYLAGATAVAQRIATEDSITPVVRAIELTQPKS
ncbi:MAG TPA: glycosyltransferase [Pseudonocardiaceae bacterium]|jgi:UDP:flavonoid glycosyltransferase YjiC (YdhE family)|nr:glycosyltransferase [Pseudonocardiaceae bacterium]